MANSPGDIILDSKKLRWRVLDQHPRLPFGNIPLTLDVRFPHCHKACEKRYGDGSIPIFQHTPEQYLMLEPIDPQPETDIERLNRESKELAEKGYFIGPNGRRIAI